MGNRVPMEPGARRMWTAIFVGIFLAVFILIVMSATIVTFILPEAYASTARILIETINPGKSAPEKPVAATDIETEAEIIQSELILDRVIDRLDLNHKWAAKFNSPTPLKNTESHGLLKRMIELRPVRNTRLIDITIYSDDKEEAKDIANTIAESYRDYRQRQREELLTNSTGEIANQIRTINVEIIDHAKSSYRPVRPNKPLNIAIGIILGGFFGVVVAGAVVTLGIFLCKPKSASA